MQTTNDQQVASTLGGEVDVHKKGLVTHIDATGRNTAGHSSDRAERGMALPFPERDLMDILNRQHLVATGAFTASMTPGANIVTVSFPGAFVPFSNIMNKLSNFAYIRFDVEVEIRPVGSAVTAGLALATWLPFTSQNEWNWLQASFLNPVHIDLGAPAATIIKIPFTHWNYAITLPFETNAPRASEHSCLKIFVEHPLRVMTGGTTSQVIMQIFARMTNVELGGDIVSNINIPTLAQKVEELTKEELLALLKKREKKEAKVKDKIVSQADIVDFIDGTAKKILGEGQSQAPTLSGTIMGGLADVIAGTLGTRPPDERSPKPVVNMHNYQLVGASGANYMQPVLNHKSYLVKKIDHSRFGDHRDYEKMNDLATLPGLITQFSITPTTAEGTVMKTIAVVPNWTDIYFEESVGDPVVTYDVVYPTPAAHVADHFLGWRGSNKYMLRFTGSQLAPCVIGWTFYPYASAIPNATQILQNQGDTVSGVINVVGSTTYKLEIPYMSPGPMVYCKKWPTDADQDLFNTGYLLIYVISPIAANDEAGNADIVCSVWHAVGEDMQWFYPRMTEKSYNIADGVDAWSPYQPGEAPALNENPAPLWYTPGVGTLKSQALLDDFKQAFMLPDKVYSMGSCDNTSESSVTFRDVVFRPRIVGVTGTANVLFGDPYKSPAPTTLNNYAALTPALMRCFRFWRGSRTIAFSATANVPMLINNSGFYDGVDLYTAYNLPHYLTTVTDLGCTIPWYCLGGDFTGCDNPFSPDDFVRPAYFIIGGNTGTANFTYRGFGDDFQFGGLVPPAFLARVQPSEVKPYLPRGRKNSPGV